MAKKYTRGAKLASKTLSSKTKSKSKYKLPAKSKTSAKNKAKRVSYKQEYIKLLEKTTKTFAKEIKAIRKAIQPEDEVSATPTRPYFKVTGRGTRSEETIATINDVLEQLNQIQSEISQRNLLLNDLINQPGKV